eukprot:SM000265S09770  [mRNA]  locus=s265:67573:70810:+ [translate_table: standard]
MVAGAAPEPEEGGEDCRPVAAAADGGDDGAGASGTDRGLGARKQPPVVAAAAAVAGLAVALALAGLATGLVSLPSLAQPPSNASSSRDTCVCQAPWLSGLVGDCCCDYETAASLNRNVLHPLLQRIVATPFFRHFKVKLWCDCPFWPDDGMCHLRDCSVCECPEGDFPEPLRGLGPAASLRPATDVACQEGNRHAAVDRTLDAAAFHSWREVDNPWTAEDEADGGDLTYVNLLLNSEGYTGYKGDSARRIWQAIYAENCFSGGLNDTCTERRIFYRLISGLHTSVSTHIAAHYLLDQAQDQWGENPAIFKERVADDPQRLQNLYFTFLFVLRAVMKASEYLSQAEYSTGNSGEDAETSALMDRLVHHERLHAACPVPFDEAQMWKGADGLELKHQLQGHFRNISALMDCVGCEKCRLWGKLQILGLGTALKILFSVDASNSEESVLHLQRNDVIALINLLARLSESIEQASRFLEVLGSSGGSSATDATDMAPLSLAHDGGSNGGSSAKAGQVLLDSVLPA